MIRPVYLDYNATTPHDPEVIEAMLPFLHGEFGNPSSSHRYGVAPKEAVKAARRSVAALLGCLPEEIVFTGGGTESNNHAIKGIALARRDRGNHIITSAVEHPAVLEVCRFLESFGCITTRVGVDSRGLVDPAEVAAAIRPGTILITIMHANNEVGTIQPVAEIGRLARERSIVMHTDAAQSVGKIPVHVDALNVDLLSVAGHKVYAPKGVGALYIRKPLQPVPFCHGAGQEMGRRAGTENVMGIAGLGRACAVAGREIEGTAAQLRHLRDRLHQGLIAAAGEVRLNGHPELRLPNTLNVSFRGVTARDVLKEIGGAVAASAGAACHGDRVEVSHVLAAMGAAPEWAGGTLRFSVGRMTTAEEIDRAIEVIGSAVRRLRG